MNGSNVLQGARKRQVAMLFGACPACLDGDLEIDCLCAEHIMAKCLKCGYAGELHSVYAFAPGGKPTDRMAVSNGSTACAANGERRR